MNEVVNKETGWTCLIACKGEVLSGGACCNSIGFGGNEQETVWADNWNAQVGEVTALLSIFNDEFWIEGSRGIDVSCFDEPSTLVNPHQPWTVCCKAAVHVLLAEPDLSVVVLEDDQASTSYAPAQALPVRQVNHLPPLYVHLDITNHYPSTHCPEATLQACWLTPAQLQQLKAELLQIWERQGATGPVMYQWLDWLHCEALTHLGLEKGLKLLESQLPDQNVCWTFATSAGRGPPKCGREWLELLDWYSAARLRHEFEQGVWACGICLECVAGVRCLRLSCCSQVFCTTCLRHLCLLHAQDGSVEQLKCPLPDCGRPLEQQVLCQLLSESEVQRVEEVRAQRELERRRDVHYCPHCQRMCVEDKDHCCMCARCFYVFCALCYQAWHPTKKKCRKPEVALELLRVKADRADRKELRERYQTAYQRQKQELASIQHIKSHTKACPGCQMATEKNGGCSKMTCTQCGIFWCFRCCKKISGYEHFREGACELFDEEELARWEERMAAERVRRQPARQPAMVAPRPAAADANRPPLRCPFCAQMNWKQGNNNQICCWACNNYFCYRCKQAITTKKVSAHYKGSGSCKQHTPD